MPTYKITDPQTKQVLRVTGDSPPSEAELEQLFVSQRPQQTDQIIEDAPPPANEPGFIDRISDDIANRGETLGSALSDVAGDIITPNPIKAGIALSKGARRLGGAVAGTAGNIIGEGVTGAANLIEELTPDIIKQPIKDTANALIESSFGKGVADAIRGGAESFQEFEKINPELAQDVKDIFNMSALIPAAKAGQIVGKGVETIGSEIKKAGGELTTLIPQTAKNKEIAQQLLLSEPKELLSPAVANSLIGVKSKSLGGPLSKELATLKLKPQTATEKLLGLDRVKTITDKVAKRAEKQGFDRAVIQSIKTGSPADKIAGRKMVNIVEKTKDNAEFGLSHRPTDIVGDSLLKRFMVVKNTNKRAGKNIGRVVRSIFNKPFDAQKIETSFVDSLNKMGINLGRDSKGKIKVDFKGSSIQGITGLEKSVKDVVKRMSESPFPTTGRAHELKKFLDEKISFDKVNSGLQGKTEQLLRGLRSSINNEIKDKSPRYAKVNKIFSETVDALDELQSLAGKNNDILGDRGASIIGQKLRGIMSNNTSRNQLINSYKNIEKLAKKYGGKFNDSIEKQVLFADELDRVFKPAGRTSFQGQISQAVDRAATATVSPAAAALKATGKAADKLGDINEKGAFAAIKELLKVNK